MWIKCSERLPAESGYYFIADPYFVGDEKHYYFTALHYSKRHEQWNNWDEQEYDNKSSFESVECWMQIPEVEE